MKDLKFPITLKFKISTFSNDFTATDAYDNTIAYVKQKMFKLKEDILVYEDETKSKINYQIKADRWIDFSAAYSITDSEGNEIGKIARKGWKSIFKAEYDLVDPETANGNVGVNNPLSTKTYMVGIKARF